MKLPVKSIARFRCVSKLWESILRSPNFTESFFTISSSRPKLLFTCLLDGKTLFFSSPQPQNSSLLTANFHMSFPINCPIVICRPVRGLVCGLNQRTVNGEIVPLICNPSTGQSLTLRRLNLTTEDVRCFLGYDPINKQFKVLCMSSPYYSEEYQVLTLGTGKKLSWRLIKCDIPHYHVAMERSYGNGPYDGVCINGIYYYVALVRDDDWYSLDIVCFDIRYEKFKCIREAQGMEGKENSILVNYKGKLAKLQLFDNLTCTKLQLWVLQYADNHKWSSYIYVLPPPWNSMPEEEKLYFVGTTSTGEIVLSPNYISDSFYLVYYNPETKNTTTIEGMEDFKSCIAYTFVDHVEDVKLMAAISK